MEDEILVLIKKFITDKNIFKALRLALKYRQNVELQYDIDNEVTMMLLEKRNFIVALRYNEKYFKNFYLESRIFNELYSEINYKVKINKLSYVRSLLNSALKKLKLDKKRKNILLNELEQINNEIILKSYPRILEIGLTGSCNLRCKMCYLSYLEDYRSKQLTQKQTNQIMELFKYAEYIMWIGGEPLIYKDFERLIDIANKFDIKQEIFTNGLLLNKNLIKKIVDYNIKLNISIDSVSEKVYEIIRVGAKFSDLIGKILSLYEYRMQRKIKNEIILVAVLSRWNYENKNNFEEIIEFANKYNFTGVNINVDNQEKNFELKEKYIQEFNLNREKLIDLAKKYSIKLEILVPDSKQDISCNNNKKIDSKDGRIKEKEIIKNAEKFCIVPWKKLYINFDGNIRINCDCPYVGNFDNIELTLDFLFNNVWNGKEMIECRKKIIDNDFNYIAKVCSHMSDGEKHLRL